MHGNVIFRLRLIGKKQIAAQQHIADHKYKQVMRRRNDHLILK